MPVPLGAATITASYEAGYRDVIINGYGTAGLGTFRLSDGSATRLALCIEADQPHSTTPDAYAPVASRTDSGELDTLIWLLGRTPVDDDTAIAAAALAWFYADAHRDIGVPVWGDGSRSFERIGPNEPEPWGALAPLSLDHPVGLRAGGVDLDSAERRVAELHRQVQSMSGPWVISPDTEAGRFQLTGSAGPIPGQPVTISVATPGSAPDVVQIVTDSEGGVAVELPDLSDGATVSATVSAPGPRQEWDGDGPVQRMITATTSELTAGFEIPPMPRHVHVLKHSTDSTISVGGGIFAITDSSGVEIERSTSDATGVAVFSPIEPVVNPAPYTVREVAAPAALLRSASDVIVDDASTDPEHPTIVEMSNDPVLIPVIVHKELSTPAAGPSDRSGFEFSVVRRQDGWTDRLVTGPSGATDPIQLALGVYDICELGSPAWAAGLQDAGCRTVDIDLDLLVDGGEVIVPYLNVVPSPSIDTTAWDAIDGDRTLSAAGGTAVDDVWLSDLVPGSTYLMIGELVALDRAGATEVIRHTTVEFVAEADLGVVQLTFQVPPLEAGTILVITEQLWLGDLIVAVHDDLTDPDQTLTLESPVSTTTAPTTTVATTTIPPTTIPPMAMPTTTTVAAIPVAATPTTLPIAATTTAPRRPVVTTPSITLPRTGNDAAAQLLRLGDIGFVVGVALIAAAGLLPRRNDRRRTPTG